MKKVEKIIPQHKKGIETNTESSAECRSEEEAKNFFRIVKERLLDVNRWHNVAGKATADFTLTDDRGNPVQRTPQKGDHFKIYIPAPGTITGQGHDWVQIEKIEEDEDFLGIRARPASNPTNKRKDIAHFFDEAATSSFIVRREKNKVIAGVYGRNEKPNTNTETTADKFRNAVIAAGAISGFAKIQWKSLVNGLVKK